MSDYILADGRGNFIKHNEFTAKFSTTCSVDLATTYPTYSRAKSILKNSLPNKMKHSFHVEELVDSHVSDVRTGATAEANICLGAHIDTVKKLGAEPVGESYLDDISSTLKTFAEFVSQKRQIQKELTDELGKVDREIVDIEHYIEFNNLNAYQGWLAFKLLQQRLRKRRVLKDNIQAIGYIEYGRINTGELNHAASCVDGLGSRQYTPRELKELFS